MPLVKRAIHQKMMFTATATFYIILMYVSIFHSLPMSPFMNMAINNMEQDWTGAGIAWAIKQFTYTI